MKKKRTPLFTKEDIEKLKKRDGEKLKKKGKITKLKGYNQGLVVFHPWAGNA